MGEQTEIAWCDGTVNVWWGCAKVDPACDNCYAEAWSRRWDRAIWGPKAERVYVKSWRSTVAKLVKRAESEDRRMRVFAQSMSDTFDNQAPQEWRGELFAVIRETAPRLDWLMLTKRIGNVQAMLPADWSDGYPNVWLGISAGTQATLDRDVPKLLAIPAAVRWVSAEPLLGPVDLTPWLCGCYSVRGARTHLSFCPRHEDQTDGIDWIVAGGESGPGARPCNVDWMREIRRQCDDAGVPYFPKQLGSHPIAKRSELLRGYPEIVGEDCYAPMRLRDSKGGDQREWPDGLGERQWPEVRHE